MLLSFAWSSTNESILTAGLSNNKSQGPAGMG